MKRPSKPAAPIRERGKTTPYILAGAEDELPSQHIWHEGEGYSIYAAEQPRSSWLKHVHDCIQVTIGLEPAHVQATWTGKSTGKSNADHQRELSGNVVSIIPAGEPHSTLWQRRAILIHLYLSQSLLDEIASQLPHQPTSELLPVYLARDIFLEELGRLLFKESQETPPGSSTLDAAVHVMAAYLLRNYGRNHRQETLVQGSLGPARERRVREYIEQHLEGDLSIHALGKLLGMNPQYFANAFRLTTGFTPHRYVSHRRIVKAQQLLQGTTLSLAEVAYQSGFKSQSQLTTLFRQFTGITPGNFRSDHRTPD
jgi:AraC family transcriptional regulator